ncbi:MAG: triphosphoribosyl-dephospho-CoA synthase CitG [Clostridia bacterium]|nr:triphosphoribosyl-dephospho-CoA synthase CitG [Clostridia bacterium]
MNKFEVFKCVGTLARQTLIDEVSATPKPGLVDKNNCGSHSDMNFDTFVSSANALESYFCEITEYGYNTAALPESDSFADARKLGLDAEKQMYEATGGVNTHKGMIFSGGLICMAVGRLVALGEKITLENICSTVAKTVKGVCEKDYSQLTNESLMTNGEKLFFKYGIKGSRGEAESGFETVREYSYPFMKKCFCEKMDENEVLVRTLLYIMGVVEDTNVIKRGGVEMGEYVRCQSQKLVNVDMADIYGFDRDLIEKNLSPGGCADILAATWLIWNIENKLSV